MENIKTENIVQELANIQSQCQELIDRIREAEKQDNELKFERVKRDQFYYRVHFQLGAADFSQTRDSCCEIDEINFNSNNYFKTYERAREVADKINFLLKLERLHDTFCPSYMPDWKSKEGKWSIYFDSYSNIYDYCVTLKSLNVQQVYFPSEEIAQKVCDILNKELE